MRLCYIIYIYIVKLVKIYGSKVGEGFNMGVKKGKGRRDNNKKEKRKGLTEGEMAKREDETSLRIRSEKERKIERLIRHRDIHSFHS